MKNPGNTDTQNTGQRQTKHRTKTNKTQDKDKQNTKTQHRILKGWGTGTLPKAGDEPIIVHLLECIF